MSILSFIKSMLKSDREWEPRYIIKNKKSGPKVRGFKKRGMGYTRLLHEESKVRRKMARESRRINRK